MLILDATNKTITAVLAGAITTSQPEATASWADDNSTTLVEGSTNIALNSTTPVTLVAAPAASTRRIIKDIYVENKDTVSVVLTVMYNNNGTTYNVEKITLSPGQSWSLQYVGDRAIGATGATGATGPTGPTGATGATGPSTITIGSTTITSGTTTRVLYDNAGVVGEYTITGTGTVVAMATAPTFVTNITTPAVLATANDSGALGAAATAFSDVFLASGALIGFANGNVVLTHSSGILTVSTGELRITSANVGTNADSVPTLSSTSTLTNKRITPRVLSAAAYTTDTGSSINGDTQDMFIVTAQTGALLFNAPSGTPTDGQKLIIQVASSTTAARALTWDSIYLATTVALPTTTAATTATLSVGFIYSSSKTKWLCVAVA